MLEQISVSQIAYFSSKHFVFWVCSHSAAGENAVDCSHPQNGPKIGTIETSHTEWAPYRWRSRLVRIRQLATVLLANGGCILIRRQRSGIRSVLVG